MAAVRGARLAGFASGGPQRDWDPLSGRTLPHALRGGAWPAGMEGLARYDGELWALYLLRKWQGQGCGRALFGAVAAELKERGFTRMLVWVLRENPACGFYERMGGKRIAEKKIVIGKELDEIAYGWETLP